jgi:hypothetical protein
VQQIVRLKRLLVLMIFELIYICGQSQAVALRVKHNRDNQITISLDGEIKSGDSAKFHAMLQQTTKASGVDAPAPTIELSSPGGRYLEGIELARSFLETGTSTVVRNGQACYSACAVAFLGGNTGGRLRNTSRKLEPGGKVGFHAPYLDLPKGDNYSQASVQFLVPPWTPIERIPDALKNYLRTEQPLRP